MTFSFTYDSSTLQLTPAAIDRALSTALRDIKNDWKAESVDIAPIDTANLRRQIKGEVNLLGDEKYVEVSANAKRKGFNYAYYIHEKDAGGANVGGEKKFLDKPAQQNKDKWLRWIEEELEQELRRSGW